MVSSFTLQKFRCRKNYYSGASAVEIALSLPLFLILVFFLIDASRYFLILGYMNFAAQQAVDLAAKLEVEVNTQDASQIAPNVAISANAKCRSVPLGGGTIVGDECDQYLIQVKRIIDQAVNTVKVVIDGPSSTRPTRLKAFTHYGTDSYPTTIPWYSVLPSHTTNLSALASVGAAFLRPGERVKQVDDNIYVEHATRPYGTPGGTAGWPGVGTNWENVLETEPLEVRLEARFAPLTPIFPSVQIRVEQFAFRHARQIKVGPPASMPVGSSPTATPITSSSSSTPPVTPVITDTPSGPPITPTQGQATATATQTAVPTVTNTPRPTTAACATANCETYKQDPCGHPSQQEACCTTNYCGDDFAGPCDPSCSEN